MAFIDELKKQNKKIFFIELEYLTDQLNTQKKYFGDYHVDLPENLTAGGTLFPCESRIQSIPFFSRKIDLFSSKINKGVYTVKLINNDGELTSFFTNNYFKNKAVNFFLTIEDYTPFDKLQLAQGTIKEVEIKDDYVSLKIDELIIYEKNIDLTKIELFNFPNQDTELKDKYKPILKGQLNNFEIKDYNINVLPKDKFVDVDIEIDGALGFNTRFVYLKTEADADLFRTIAKEGDFIELPNGQQLEISKINPKGIGSVTNNREISIVGVNFQFSDGTIKLKNNSDFNSPLFDNRYYVTKNVSELTSTFTANLSVGDTTLTLTEDWKFLSAGDTVIITSDSFPEKTEEFEVVSYDSGTQLLTLNNPIAIAKTTANYYVKYYTVNKIKINDIEYFKKRNSFDVFPNRNGGQFNNTTRTASLSINGLTFTADSSGEAGNGTEIVFKKTKKYDPVAGYEIDISENTVTNKYGAGQTQVQIDFYEGAKAQDIKDALDAYDLINPLAFTTVVDSNDITKEYFYRYNDKEQRRYIIEGGEVEADYYDEWIGQNITIDTNIPLTYALYFGVDGDTTIPTRVKSFDIKIRVDILSTDTTTQVNTKIKDAINTNNSVIFPFTCDENGLLKFAGYSKYPISKNRSTKGQNINFFEFVQDGDDFYIEVEKKAFNIARNKLGVTVTEYTCDIPGAYYGASNSEQRKLVSYVSGFSKGEVDFVVENGFKDLDFLDTFLILDYENLSQQTRNKYLQVWRNADEDGKYLNSELDEFDQDENINVAFYPNEKIEDFTVYYKDQFSHVSDTIKELMTIYNISSYSTSDLDTIKTDHPDFLTKLVVDESKKLYEYLNEFIISFNLFSYIDQSGNIRFKFFHPYDSTASELIDFNSLISFSQKFNSIDYSRVENGIIEDIKESSYTVKELTEEFTTELASITNFDNLKEYKTQIMKDFFSSTYDSYTYEKLFVSKYLTKSHEIKIIGDLDIMTYEIGDLISVDNNNEIDNTYKFLITEIKTNGEQVEIKAIRFLITPEVLTNIVDENDNLLIDENNNLIIAE